MGRSEFWLDKMKDQQRRKVTLEVKHHAENIRVVGEITLDLVWLHSHTELCKSLLGQYDQELKALKILLDKHKTTLTLLQEPFEPLIGYEIAPKVSKIDPNAGRMAMDADTVTKSLFRGTISTYHSNFTLRKRVSGSDGDLGNHTFGHFHPFWDYGL